MNIILASRSRGKIAEYRSLMAPHQLVELPADFILPPEDGLTFVENALAKARAAHADCPSFPALGDDSGLVVPYLDGAPGVRSARFARDGATDGENNRELLDRMRNASDHNRTAYFCTALAYVGAGVTSVKIGYCYGSIAGGTRGGRGFGYEPVFEPFEDSRNRTFAEMTAEEKALISHRADACGQMLAVLR